MPLRPEDVVRKSFSGTLLKRGYDETEVDAFLEEVVIELRRLYAQIDELQATISMGGAGATAESMQLTREVEQLEMVRAERQQLVQEMAEMQAELDRLTAEVAARRASS
jgi:DivIVA domain-containing protein